MMKKLLSVFISVILMTGFVIGCAAGTEKPVIVILSADEIPAREWQKMSIGLDEETDVSAQLMDLLADMAAESLKLIPDGAGSDHPSVKNAQSKIAVLKA